MTTWQLKQALAEASRQVAEAGLVPGKSGNVSVRTKEGLLVTPSGLALGNLAPDDIVELEPDADRPRRGRVRTSEWRLHRDIYLARSDVNAVVHTHSRFATVFSCLRRELTAVHYMIALAGTPVVRCAEYATYGTEALSKNALAALGNARACLLANHGLVAAGKSLDEAVRIAAELEHLASLEWHARAIGTPVVLDAAEVARVAEKFETYGKESP